MRYQDAIEHTQHLALMCRRYSKLIQSAWGTRQDAVEGVVNANARLDGYAKPPAADEFARTHLYELFSRATPYYVNTRLLNVIEATAPAVPAHTRLAAHMFPTPYGCLLYERPVANFPMRRLIDKPGMPTHEPAPMSGFAWNCGSDGVALIYLYSWGVDSQTPNWLNGVYIGNIPLSVTPWDFARSTMATYVNWHNDRIIRNNDGTPGDSENARRFDLSTRHAVATLLLMNQTITHVTRTPVDRATRKRAVKTGWTHAPEVHVIELRRIEVRERNDNPAHVDWSCRWFVSAHWRTLHRNTPDERTILVHPYIKGPADKPVRPPSPRVFALVR